MQRFTTAMGFCLCATIGFVALWSRGDMTHTTCQKQFVTFPSPDPYQHAGYIEIAALTGCSWIYICRSMSKGGRLCHLDFPNGNVLYKSEVVLWSKDKHIAVLSWESRQGIRPPTVRDIDVWNILEGVPIVQNVSGYGFMWLPEAPVILGYVEIKCSKVTPRGGRYPISYTATMFNIETGEIMQPATCPSWFTPTPGQPLPIQCQEKQFPTPTRRSYP